MLLFFFKIDSYKNDMLDTVNNYNNNNNRKEKWVDVGAHVEWLLQLLTPIEEMYRATHKHTQEDRIDRVKKKGKRKKKKKENNNKI